MILNPLMTFLGTQDLPEKAKSLVQKVVILIIGIDFILNLSITFYVLFVIDIAGLDRLGILLGISFLLQAVLDYPSGVLGDWVGQRWILFVGFFIEGLAFVVLVYADSFPILMVVYALRAIGYSQQSGAIGTWLDNNYKIAVGENDPQRETYKFFTGRLHTIGMITPAISVIIGGTLATVYQREFVFAITAVGLVGLAVVFLFIVTDFPEMERPKRSLRNYFILLGDGLKVVFFSKMMFFLMVGFCISVAMTIVWFEMVLFPLYFGYTGSDAGTSILRSLILIVGIPLAFYTSRFAVKLNLKWLPKLRFIDSGLFFWGMALITLMFPIEENLFRPIAVFLTIITYASVWYFFHVAQILQQRILLDFIPDKNRNSVYSLIPTLILFSAPSVFLGGILLENLGVPVTLFLLGVVGMFSAMFYSIALRYLPLGSSDFSPSNSISRNENST